MLQAVLNMPKRVTFGRQYVARPCIMTERTKCVADCCGKLTSDKNPHLPRIQFSISETRAPTCFAAFSAKYLSGAGCPFIWARRVAMCDRAVAFCHCLSGVVMLLPRNLRRVQAFSGMGQSTEVLCSCHSSKLAMHKRLLSILWPTTYLCAPLPVQ